MELKRGWLKNISLTLGIILCLIHVHGQIKSSHDGFYSTDSVFYQLSGKDSFAYCVNCYSADSLKKYTGGIWLYSREHAPNTWENSQFSKPNEMFSDTGHMRSDVVKANTIWVRIFDGKRGYTDQHHFVFLGNWRPKTSEFISVFIDSSDFMGPGGFYGPGRGMATSIVYQWNYMLKIEKKCSYQVYGGTNLQLEAEQTAGVEISANLTQSYPNKAIELNANETGYKKKVLLLGKSLTDSLGDDIKVLRLRVGGNNHKTNLLVNEIALDILRPDQGGEPSTPICLFINGSFWTYALAEEGLGKNHIAKETKTANSQLLCTKIPSVYSATDMKNAGLTMSQISDSLYSICGFFYPCMISYICHDTTQFIVDTSDINYNASALNTFYHTVKNGSDSLLAASINREAFYRYALSIWFFQNETLWAGFITAAKAGAKPWTLFADHYDCAMSGSEMLNDWYKYFINCDIMPHDGSAKTLPWLATRRMLDYDRDYFCLVIEDELNTTYNTERTVPIAKKKIISLRPCISECSKAWWPFDWIDSTSWEASVSGIIPFLKVRPTGIAAALPKNFMSGSDTLLTLKDRNHVTINLDSVQGKDVTVKLNSLEIKSNFSGLYYPKPELRIALDYDNKKYKFIKWLEYPNTPSSFKLSANKSITLTPILKTKN